MILVTGGTGLVGSHLLLELAEAGERVRAIHRKNSSLEGVKKVFSYDRPQEEAQRLLDSVEWIEADTLEVPALAPAFEGITHVYHCAALVSFSPSDDKKLRKINIEGTANVVNLCIEKRVQKLCFVSSIATFDLKLGQKQIDEHSHWNKEIDHSMYAISKYGAEMEVWRASQEGIPVVIVNPGVIIGPGFWNTGSGTIFKRIWNGLNYSVHKVTGFIGVKDVVKAMHLLMRADTENEQFLLVSENLSFKTVLGMAAGSLGKPAPSKTLKPWMVSLGWLGQLFLSLFGKKRELRRDSSKSLFSDSYYTSNKFESLFQYRFEKIDAVIERTGNYYKKEITE